MNIMPLAVFLAMMALLIGLVVFHRMNIYSCYALLPILAAVLLGFGAAGTLELFRSRIMEAMTGSALLVLFSVAFFSALSETGMFAVIVYAIVKCSGGKPLVVYLATLAVGLVTSVDGSLITCYAITIPAFLAIYQALELDRKKLLFLSAISVVITLPLPWNAVTTSIAAANQLDNFELFYACIPSMLLIAAATAGLCIRWGTQDKGKARALDDSILVHPRRAQDKPLYRIRLFWVNLALCVAAIVMVVCYRALPAWSTFMLFFFVTLAVNYRNDRDCMAVFNRAAPVVLLFLMILLPVMILVGVMVGSGMVKTVVGVLMKLLPGPVLKYFFLIMALLLPLILKYLPYQIMLGFLPVFTLLAGQYGVSALCVCIPFTANICLGSLSSPAAAQTQLGLMLSQVDLKEFQKFSLPKQWLINGGVLLIGLLLGFYGV